MEALKKDGFVPVRLLEGEGGGSRGVFLQNASGEEIVFCVADGLGRDSLLKTLSPHASDRRTLILYSTRSIGSVLYREASSFFGGAYIVEEDIRAVCRIHPRSLPSLEEVFSEFYPEKTLRSRENTVTAMLKGMPFTIFIMVVNFAVFFYLQSRGNTESADYLYQNGALLTGPGVKAPEWWRFLASGFLHFGYAHLLNNMLTLFILGEDIEKRIGAAKLALVYFGSLILSSLGSYAYHVFFTPGVYTVSAGASGAIYGVLGAMITDRIIFRSGSLRNTLGRIFLVLLFSVLPGIQIQGIDHAAHITGLFSGLLILLAFREIRHGKQGSKMV